ncbi:MAG: hypothetical protein Q8K92_08310 [Leadbetterella sp.]|nr:hypothetical protein [Leadbetterella sp.]
MYFIDDPTRGFDNTPQKTDVFTYDSANALRRKALKEFWSGELISDIVKQNYKIIETEFEYFTKPYQGVRTVFGTTGFCGNFLTKKSIALIKEKKSGLADLLVMQGEIYKFCLYGGFYHYNPQCREPHCFVALMPKGGVKLPCTPL